jgi:predicted DNA-binding transcriptional regulator AlpA
MPPLEASQAVLVHLVPASEWTKMIERVESLEAQYNSSREFDSTWMQEQEVAKFLGRTKKWVWRKRKEGLLNFSKVGRATYYRRAEVIALLDRNEVKRFR